MNQAADQVTAIKISGHGGTREGAGRKPSVEKFELAELKEKVMRHGIEEVEGFKWLKGMIGKKGRVLMLLERLFDLGMGGNVLAAREYLVRTLGQPREVIDIYHPNEEEDPLKALVLIMAKNERQSRPGKEDSDSKV